jgi:hypothetical protein
MPVARVMKLYRHHIGLHAVAVTACPDGLDVVASRTGDRLFLHVVNPSRNKSSTAELSLSEGSIGVAVAHQIVDDPMVEVFELNSSEVMQAREMTLPSDGRWSFPPASVTAVEVTLTA